jgi:hypothetical protein
VPRQAKIFSVVPFNVQEPSRPELIVNPREARVLPVKVELLTIGSPET